MILDQLLFFSTKCYFPPVVLLDEKVDLMKCLLTKFNGSSKLTSAHVMFESRVNARFGVKQRKEKKKKYFS